MGRIPNQLRETIAKNIRECRVKKFPGRGGGKRCAEAFGVSPQQWSPWERGNRTPDEIRLQELAKFFGVTVEYLRADHSQDRSESHSQPSEQSESDRPASPGMPRQSVLPPMSQNVADLLENSNRLMWLLIMLRDDALIGKRNRDSVTAFLRHIRYDIENNLPIV